MAQHRPRFRPSVTVAAVIEDGGRFLLVEEQTPEGLKLNNPAGHLEAGESPEQAVVREALEETGRDFEPQALLGVYLSRFVRPREAGRDEDVTYLRIAYRGRVGEPVEGRTLDRAVVRTLWLTPDEIREQAPRHRSPLVMRCIDDHLAGRALPLDAVQADGSLLEPEVKPARRGDGPREAGSRRERRPEHEPRTTPETAAASPAAAPRAPEPTLAETAAALAERFPALFTPGAPKPIKLRVQADIQERTRGAFTRKALSIFLHRHTTSTAYLKALVSATHRYDLDGAEAGPLHEEHRQAAQAELDRRRQIVLERRAAERAARPPQPPAEAPPHPRRERPDRPPERRADAQPKRSARGPEGEAPTAGPLPDDPERRARALLLRAWEGSTLTPANFCVLKRIDPKQFDGLIEQARRERGERRAAAPAQDPPAES